MSDTGTARRRVGSFFGDSAEHRRPHYADEPRPVDEEIYPDQAAYAYEQGAEADPAVEPGYESYDQPPELAPQAARATRRGRLRYDPSSPRGRDVYRDARRHSRLVRWLRIVLPVLALIGAGLFWGTARFIPSEFDDIVSVAGIDIESNSVVMDTPQISGFEGTRRAYLVKAASAVQNLNDPKVITFNQIDASLGLDEAGTATISAPIGVYDGNRNTLTIDEGATLTTTDGYRARLTDAAIDLGEGSLSSDKPLEIGSNDGTLRANGVRIEERGKRISFVNGVSLKFVPPAELLGDPDTLAIPEAPE